ncbi:MAG: DUF4399 domain-containing protein [Myxococcota bacterium]
MTFFRVTTLVAASFAIAVLAWADGGALPRTDAPDDAEAYIINPKDGDTVKSPVTVVFGIRGMGVAPAGVDRPNTGHHHIVIDAPTPDLDKPITSDDHHVHFGGGQTEVTLELSSGPHTLQLVLGDRNHLPHTNAVVSKPITITVK